MRPVARISLCEARSFAVVTSCARVRDFNALVRSDPEDRHLLRAREGL